MLLRVLLFGAMLVGMAQARTITVIPPSAPGLAMVQASGHPLVAQIEREQKAAAGQLLPWSVLLKNGGPQKIVAYTVRWEFGGQRAGGLNRSYHNFDSTDTGIEIHPGETQLVTPLWAHRCCQSGTIPRTKEKSMAMVMERFGSQPSVTISLDLVVYDDGLTVGPNQSGTLAFLAKYVSAMEEIPARILANDRAGVSFDVTKAYLRQAAQRTGHESPSDQARIGIAEHLLSVAELGRDRLMADVAKLMKYPSRSLHPGETK